jgi:hypothetical protein
VRLEPLRKLRGLDELSDDDMARVQRAHLLDPTAPVPSLELLLRADAIELRGHLAPLPEGASGNGRRTAAGRDDVVFFCAPLDPALLAEFRSPDPLAVEGEGSAENGGGNPGADEMAASASSWQAYYSGRNEALGIEWQLRLRDLGKKAEWDRWRILESAAVPYMTD